MINLIIFLHDELISEFTFYMISKKQTYYQS